jgi:porphyromonas gingivalis family protein
MYIFPTAYGPSDKYQVIDTARYEITYQINAKLNPNPKYSFVAYKDVQTLLIGKKVSATYSRDILKAREVADEEMRKGAQTVEDFSEITFPEDVFKGYPRAGELTTSYRLFLGAGYGQYTEALPSFKWQILSESKEILGYKCQKAQGEFRGRKYIAWFAPSIPISDGPWKFCDLPGLILAVEDMDKYFVFTCIDIKNNQSQPIRFWTYPHIKCSREKLRATIQRMHKQPIVFCEQALGEKIYIGKTNTNRNFSFLWLWLEVE